jgi:hypothetical protein
MRRSLVKTVAWLAGWRAVGLVAAAVLLAGWSFGQTAAPEKKAAEGQKPSAAEQKELPKADELLREMVEAMGGEAAIKSVKTRISKGTLQRGQEKGTITSYEMAPDKSALVTEIGGQKIEEGSNGQVVWRKLPHSAELVQGEEAAIAMRHNDMYLPLNWRKYYTSAETTGTTMVDDHPAYKILMTPKEDPPETWYIDEKTHLMDRTDLNVPELGTIETYFEDYRKEGGVMVPYKLRQVFSGFPTATITLTSVEQNVEIPKDRFEPPPGLKEGGKEPTPPGQPPQPPKPERPVKPETPVKP